jgi:hypothetical protein
LSGHNVQSKGGQIVQVEGEGGHYTGHYTGHSPRITHGETQGNGPDSQDSQDSHKNKKEEDSKIGLSRGPTAPEKESKPSSSDSPKPSLQPACEVPPAARPGWRDRLDEPPVLTGEERAAWGRLAALPKANGSAGATVVSS